MDILNNFQKTVDRHLSLRSYPVAIKLVKHTKELPLNMGRPARDLGQTIRPCVGWHLARHRGLPIAMLLEDFTTACPSGIFVFGLMAPTPSWLNGDLSCGIYSATREAAVNMEKHVFRLEVGSYVGVAFAPLAKANFTPDLIMTFCNSNDARRLIIASAWDTGEPLKVSITGRDLCSEAIVQPFLSQKPVLAIPCRGDRQHGATHDDEIVFTTPMAKLEGIVTGLEEFEKSHRVEYLGEETELQRRYKEMAKTLDAKLGR